MTSGHASNVEGSIMQLRARILAPLLLAGATLMAEEAAKD
jgi:hypothetical protein